MESAKLVLTPHEVSFLHAVLRRAAKEKEAVLELLKDQPLDTRSSHPKGLVEKWTATFGQDDTERLCQWNNQDPPLVLRICTSKISVEEFLKLLEKADVKAVPHPYNPQQSIQLLTSYPVSRLPGYEKGLFFVQDPSAHVAVKLLNPEPGSSVLDLCAAPGGKTMHIAEAMQGHGLHVAMDLHKDRLKILEENIQRLGLSTVHIRQGDGTDKAQLDEIIHNLKQPSFNRILLDVPCTNTGVIRRRPDVRWRYHPDRLAHLNHTQSNLLDQASTLLAPNGSLVYSTCSLEPEENEEMIRNWLARHPGFILTAQTRLFPPNERVDGCYAALLAKLG